MKIKKMQKTPLYSYYSLLAFILEQIYASGGVV